ncbi:hypothetical protein [Roseivirga sp.]|uniref:hypothetical protein n=1 Tax=Roseivirga sp. TaxID=1964215 RepID=UPI002B2712DB|nr:hypothetical protein [Roseivirga sp.]
MNHEQRRSKNSNQPIVGQYTRKTLQEVYDYLKSVQGKSDKSVSLSQNLRTILTEDKELLERLAQ